MMDPREVQRIFVDCDLFFGVVDARLYMLSAGVCAVWSGFVDYILFLGRGFGAALDVDF